MLSSIALLALALPSALADVYLHNPRGSNNRLNEANAVRNNGNRMFDSQNNNRGGYNTGDRTDDAFDTNDPMFANPDDNFDYTDTASNKQYQMGYYEQSKLTFEWTNQHACGGSEGDDPQKVNCNIIIQYMCDIEVAGDRAMTVALRDGGNTNTPNDANNYAQTDPATDNDDDTGRQESKAFYYECTKRKRNEGLFTADQKLNGDTAEYTRQNPNGNQNGLECPEERDYYPYWYPTPWIDAAYLTDHTESCEYFKTGSQNTATVYKCDGLVQNDDDTYITQAECTANGGTWVPYTKALPAPECKQAPWSRTNQLGNSAEGSEPANYTWTLPTFSTPTDYTTYGQTYPSKRCVARLRYNISTDDYDPWNTTAEDNDIIENNPVVDAGVAQGLRLAINTNQFGRTFQDRTHTFYVVERPAAFVGKAITNLNVRGKRGNIVQVYPSVEYDFIPTRLKITEDELMHVQWTGSNTHNNGGGGGDGQAGDDGQGQGGTDRNNFVLTDKKASSFPIPLDKAEFDEQNMMKKSTCYDLKGAQNGDWVDCAVIMATSGYARSKTADFTDFNDQMNNAPASLIGGMVMQSTKGEYNYMSSRNNNFSNRGQKGSITIV